jgi:hypothetical protein
MNKVDYTDFPKTKLSSYTTTGKQKATYGVILKILSKILISNNNCSVNKFKNDRQ